MEIFLLLAQAILLALAGVVLLRARQYLHLLLRQVDARYAELQSLQEQLQHTLREVRVTLSEGTAQLEQRLARAEQVLQALEACETSVSPSVPTEADATRGHEQARVPVERILALAESGCDRTEIARLTGVAEGEVALVLQLRTSQAPSLSEKEISLGGGTDA